METSLRVLQYTYRAKCAHMRAQANLERCFMDPKRDAPIGLRQARAGLSRLVDDVSEGTPVVISRRGRPMAALISAADFERFRELERRDEGLRAVFRGRGFRVAPWTTPKILELLSRLAGES